MRLPGATVGRLLAYLGEAERYSAQVGAEATISSRVLAEAAASTSEMVRRDLWLLGLRGTRGVGYGALALISRTRAVLRMDTERRVAIVGIGSLGRALARYPRLAGHGFAVAALFDIDPATLEEPVGGLPVRPVSECAKTCRRLGVGVGVVSVPPDSAQDAAAALVEGGVRSILNFAPANLHAPPGIVVRQLDFLAELTILAHHAESPRSPEVS